MNKVYEARLKAAKESNDWYCAKCKDRWVCFFGTSLVFEEKPDEERVLRIRDHVCTESAKDIIDSIQLGEGDKPAEMNIDCFAVPEDTTPEEIEFIKQAIEIQNQLMKTLVSTLTEE
jgi:uncharacterized protein YutE (UPF0331/DUF86 family)